MRLQAQTQCFLVLFLILRKRNLQFNHLLQCTFRPHLYPAQIFAWTPTPTSASIQKPLPKLQPKRQSLTSSLSEHLKHRDLEWFKAHHQPAASPDSKPLSPAAPGPPSAPNVSNDVTGPPAEKIRPSRMPGRIPLRPASSEPTTVNEPATPANAVDLPGTSSFTEISVPTDAKELNQEEIVPTMVDVVMNHSQRRHVPQGSETLLLDTPGDVVPKLTTPPEPNTDSLAPSQPPAISLSREHKATFDAPLQTMGLA
ncbi:hypothetical protein BDR07DRAFT_552446 [Suillus spraguei]|nr:hypothetical protein BDR07DRAFT_552446 [Suillus spraguei]